MIKGLAKIGDVKFGKLDAYSEYMEYGKDMYKSLFLASPNFHVEKFLTGKTYYIHGEKGTGKTALLKYIQIIAEENSSYIEYIRFKKDIDDDDRNQIKRAGLEVHPFEQVIESEIPLDYAINCILAWEVYIIKSIVTRLQKEKDVVFARDDEWKKLATLIKGAYPEERINIRKILPKLTKGNIKLNIASKASVGVEFEWADEKEKLVNFNAFAKMIVSIYENLTPCNNSCYILFDELELVNINKKKYTRDVSLIRDLIQAVYYINEIGKTHKYNVFTIACIRNEVYRSAAAVGRELNKYIQDYGVEISWTQNGGSINDHPLIRMIENRLIQSQSEEIKAQYSSVWDEYICESVGKRDTKNYIIDQTWNKPRDITRLFMLIQKRAENTVKIDASLFESVRAKYSSEAWEEFSNELSAKYSTSEIQAIKLVLTGMTIPFTLSTFQDRIQKYKDLGEDVFKLAQNRKPADILSDLYRVGIIGTISIDNKWTRFVFKGNEDFDLLSQYTVHYPLRRFFSVVTAIQ